MVQRVSYLLVLSELKWQAVQLCRERCFRADICECKAAQAGVLWARKRAYDSPSRCFQCPNRSVQTKPLHVGYRSNRTVLAKSSSIRSAWTGVELSEVSLVLFWALLLSLLCTGVTSGGDICLCVAHSLPCR